MPKDRFVVSISRARRSRDDEAYDIGANWASRPIASSSSGEDDNFGRWRHGPCGRCSGSLRARGAATIRDRTLEQRVMEFERSKDGTLTPLPAQSIDTGLARTHHAVMQGKQSNYDTDSHAAVVRIARCAAEYAPTRPTSPCASSRITSDRRRSHRRWRIPSTMARIRASQESCARDADGSSSASPAVHATSSSRSSIARWATRIRIRPSEMIEKTDSRRGTSLREGSDRRPAPSRAELAKVSGPEAGLRAMLPSSFTTRSGPVRLMRHGRRLRASRSTGRVQRGDGTRGRTHATTTSRPTTKDTKSSWARRSRSWRSFGG